MFNVKYIRDLSATELQTLRDSGLWKNITSEYYFLDSSIAYYSHYHDHSYKDARMVVYFKEEPVLAAYLYYKEGHLSYFHFPVSLFAAACPKEILNSAYKYLFKELELLCEREKLQTGSFYANEFFISRYFNDITEIKTNHFCIVDLELSEEIIKTNIRKSYKSLVNWGKSNLNTRVADDSTITAEDFSGFRNFHLKVAGRTTRSEETWNTQLQMIRNKEAFLVMAELDGKLVSANLVMCGNKEAFYAVGVNDRELMEENKPISHYPLLHSIFEAKRKGYTVFNMNEIDMAGTDQKVDNIAKFKKGFSCNLRPMGIYKVKFATTDPSTN